MRDRFWHSRAVYCVIMTKGGLGIGHFDLPITKHRHRHRHKHKLRRRVTLVDCPVRPVPVPIPLPSPSVLRPPAAQADIATYHIQAFILETLTNFLSRQLARRKKLRPIVFPILFWSTYMTTPCSSP